MLSRLQTSSLAKLWRTLAETLSLRRVPLLGSIIAGSPSWQDACVDTCIDVDADTLQLPKNARPFALKVRGDSMKQGGILDGDVVVMELREAKHGDVVAAYIDGECTLKRYLVKNGAPFLRAANPKYPDLIPAHELVIQGVMIALLRLPGR